MKQVQTIKDIELNDEGLLFLNEYEKSLTEISD